MLGRIAGAWKPPEVQLALFALQNYLGEFEVADIPPAPRGEEKFDVTFDVDANGILTVSARNRSTGNENGIVLETGLLSEADVQRMVTEADIFKV